MKKIAVPTKNNLVDSHFGQCEYYSIYSIDNDDKIKDMELFAAPQGCGCKSDIASILANKGVSLMLAGNIGMGAINVLQSHDIDLVRGCDGKVTEVIKLYLSGKLLDSRESCANHNQPRNEGHQCEHH